jgi:hypothetical protein
MPSLWKTPNPDPIYREFALLCAAFPDEAEAARRIVVFDPYVLDIYEGCPSVWGMSLAVARRIIRPSTHVRVDAASRFWGR